MITKDKPVEIIQPNRKVHVLRQNDGKTACGREVSKDETRDKICIKNFKMFFSKRYDLCGTCENSKTFLKAIQLSEELK